MRVPGHACCASSQGVACLVVLVVNEEGFFFFIKAVTKSPWSPKSKLANKAGMSCELWVLLGKSFWFHLLSMQRVGYFVEYQDNKY